MIPCLPPFGAAASGVSFAGGIERPIRLDRPDDRRALAAAPGPARQGFEDAQATFICVPFAAICRADIPQRRLHGLCAVEWTR